VISQGYFYGPDKLAALFPEEFEEMVPERVIALTVTAVSPT
jgi:hypothetical protein